jgi:hypothetical protein
MYVLPNFKTKKALKDAIANGVVVTTFAPGLGEPIRNGVETIEGPHFPEPHRWYARVQVVDGRVTKVVG